MFGEEESQMLGNLLKFESVRVSDVMTPRTVVAAASEESTIIEFYDQAKRLRFSRMPTYNQSKDHITGYVMKNDILSALVEGQDQELVSTLRRDILTIGESFNITELFSALRDRQEHIALVLDDFGGMAGIVTLEDVIETLLGLEIVDETDATTDMRILAQRHRARRAKVLNALDSTT